MLRSDWLLIEEVYINIYIKINIPICYQSVSQPAKGRQIANTSLSSITLYAKTASMLKLAFDGKAFEIRGDINMLSVPLCSTF